MLTSRGAARAPKKFSQAPTVSSCVATLLQNSASLR